MAPSGAAMIPIFKRIPPYSELIEKSYHVSGMNATRTQNSSIKNSPEHRSGELVLLDGGAVVQNQGAVQEEYILAVESHIRT